MARKKHSRGNMETRTSFMFESLHGRVVDAVSNEIPTIWFKRQDTSNGSIEEYPTHVMGRFGCKNKECPQKGWGSKKIAILIRGFPNNGYNAVVFNQRCRSCNGLGSLVLDEDSYVDRVAYRVRKWAGVPTGRQHYGESRGPPHESSLCEGCQRGFCQRRE
jgi:hypothetical protein